MSPIADPDAAARSEPTLTGDPERTLREGAETLGIALTPEQSSQLLAFLRRVLEANRVLNLTAIAEPAEAVVKHLLDSLTLLRVLPDQERLRLIDVGTGAGFPGVPLRILRPSWSLTLLDARQKRVRALQGLLSDLQLTQGIDFCMDRAEIAGQRWDFRHTYDAAVARAVAPLDVLAELCLPFVKPGGHFVAMKGPKAEEERQQAKAAIKACGGRLNRVESLELPFGAGQRSLVVIDKTKLTPNRYPRRPGEPERNPIREGVRG